MDATLQRIDRLINLALEQVDFVKGTAWERYAEHLLDTLICRREWYTRYLSMLN